MLLRAPAKIIVSVHKICAMILCLFAAIAAGACGGDRPTTESEKQTDTGPVLVSGHLSRDVAPEGQSFPPNLFGRTSQTGPQPAMDWNSCIGVVECEHSNEQGENGKRAAVKAGSLQLI